MPHAIDATTLVAGDAQGPLLWSDVGLSFWGGVDPATGIVIDRHHPLAGQPLAGRVLALPSGRGSCSGSGVLMELIASGNAPAAIVVAEREEILTLGALVADEMFGRSMPLVRIARDDFDRIRDGAFTRIALSRLHIYDTAPTDGWQPAATPPATSRQPAALHLAGIDRALLDGAHGKAAAIAMRLLVRMAEVYGASRFIDVTQAHVDGCFYTGPASLAFAERLVDWGARVRVPTTLNAISVDRRRWRELGIPEGIGAPGSAVADAYVAMGARPSFTCAPYLLPTAPARGAAIGWAESNAVVYANSVLGARTMKYPDYLDICIALTGRAPLAGCHTDDGRRAMLAIDVELPGSAAGDDALWPLLGYCCGLASASDIPLVRGLERASGGSDAMKAFGAAFATTSAAPMFHIAGHTPEAAGQSPPRAIRLSRDDLGQGWRELDAAPSDEVDLVSLGNPHFSLSECARLADLVRGRTKSPRVEVVVTLGRDVHEAAIRAGHVATAEAFGVRFVTDTCWCFVGEPLIPPAAHTLMTNSGKYAHYGPGLVGRAFRFGNLAACIEAARTGCAPQALPDWLQDAS